MLDPSFSLSDVQHQEQHPKAKTLERAMETGAGDIMNAPYLWQIILDRLGVLHL